jgi:hypothetical protein
MKPLVLCVLNPDDMIVTRYVKSYGLKVYVSHRGLLQSPDPAATVELFRTDPPEETRV